MLGAQWHCVVRCPCGPAFGEDCAGTVKNLLDLLASESCDE